MEKSQGRFGKRAAALKAPGCFLERRGSMRGRNIYGTEGLDATRKKNRKKERRCVLI